MENQSDPFDLARFTSAQESVHAAALAELKAGRKRSHWMWFVFPQIDGLGLSWTTKRYSIKSLAEARRYIEHPVLGPRLQDCCQALLSLEGRTAHEVFGSPDDMKLKSSMTLFAAVSAPGSIFTQVLDKYYRGEKDSRTIELIQKLKS